MSAFVVPKVWGMNEELSPLDLNDAIRAVGISVNNISNMQIAAAAGIPSSKISTTPGSRVGSGQILDGQVTQAKLIAGNAFTRETLTTGDDYNETGAGQTITNSVALFEQIFYSANPQRGGHLVIGEVVGTVRYPASGPEDVTMQVFLEQDGSILSAAPVKFRAVAPVGPLTVEWLPWCARIMDFSRETSGSTRSYTLLGQLLATSSSIVFHANSWGLSVLELH
jgi:hypothetical protein